MKRGEIVTVALNGDYGKPRPAAVIQNDLFGGTGSATILPITSYLSESPSMLRINIEPDSANGLRKPSQIMVDKIAGVPRRKLSAPFGTLDEETMIEVGRVLALFLGIS